MRARTVAIVFVYSCTLHLVLASAPDHLVPPYQDQDWGIRGYGSFLEKKLFLTPADYGRILVLPSAGSIGEYSLSIYPSSRAGVVGITYVKASRNIWTYLSAKSSKATPPPVHEVWEVAPLRFNRIDATLSESAGGALRGALAAMIRGTRGQYPGTTRVIVDGYDIQFSVVESGKTITGVITAGLSGKNVSELHKLVDLLANYCQAPANRRDPLMNEIKRKATQVATGANET